MFMSIHTHISEKPHMEFSHFKKKFHFQASAAIKKNLKIKFPRRSWPWSAGKGHLFCRS